MRALPFCMAGALLIPPAWADDIKLRCEGTYNRQLILLSIDTSKSTIHWGEDSNSGWYTDGNKYSRVGDSHSQSANACRFVVTQFVRITSSIIRFGEIEASTNKCNASPIEKYTYWNDSSIYTINRDGRAQLGGTGAPCCVDRDNGVPTREQVLNIPANFYDFDCDKDPGQRF